MCVRCLHRQSCCPDCDHWCPALNTWGRTRYYKVKQDNAKVIDCKLNLCCKFDSYKLNMSWITSCWNRTTQRSIEPHRSSSPCKLMSSWQVAASTIWYAERRIGSTRSCHWSGFFLPCDPLLTQQVLLQRERLADQCPQIPFLLECGTCRGGRAFPWLLRGG